MNMEKYGPLINFIITPFSKDDKLVLNMSIDVDVLNGSRRPKEGEKIGSCESGEPIIARCCPECKSPYMYLIDHDPVRCQCAECEHEFSHESR